MWQLCRVVGGPATHSCVASNPRPAPPRPARVQGSAVAFCTAIFLSVAVGSQVAFGRGAIPADVLTLFNGERLAPLVGGAAARVLYVLVRLGFLLSIITIFPMQVRWVGVEGVRGGC